MSEEKHEILEKLSETIYGFKAYPDMEHFENVAAALIKKHPCLTQPGSSKGWNGWYDSLRWKMGNYCSKLQTAGCMYIFINAGKEGDNSLRETSKNQKGMKSIFYLISRMMKKSSVFLLTY